MNLSNKKSVQEIVLALAELGLKEVIICPGSRNAPLTISFNRHPAFRCTSVRDERSAAFFALGKCIELGEPVAVVCSSGSAPLNFAPAVAEAYYQRLPLILLTADRPGEWVDQGDGQTIDQKNIYQNYIRRSYHLFGDTAKGDEIWYNTRCLSEGFSVATALNPGPVHFNIPLSEPLYDLEEIAGHSPRVFKPIQPQFDPPEKEMQQLLTVFSQSRKVMVLVGQHRPDPAFENSLQKIASHSNTIVLCESTGNVHDAAFIENIDRVITNLTPEEAVAFMPDLLITVGGAVVSKRIKAILRKHRPKEHWNVDKYDANMDTYQSLTLSVYADAARFLSVLANATPPAGPYGNMWREKSNQLKKLHERFCDRLEYSDLYVFSRIYECMPPGLQLHIGNSSPIRYAQLFCNGNATSVWSNRGTSGIDGSTSTAMGAASTDESSNFLLITGDVAFHYDINAFWNESAPENLKVILINNGGGGIFRIIPGPAGVDELEEFFETSQQIGAEKPALHFGWNYRSATNAEEVERELPAFFKERGRVILEIFTPSAKNALVLKDYWNSLKNGDAKS